MHMDLTADDEPDALPKSAGVLEPAPLTPKKRARGSPGTGASPAKRPRIHHIDLSNEPDTPPKPQDGQPTPSSPRIKAETPEPVASADSSANPATPTRARSRRIDDTDAEPLSPA